MNLHRTRTKSLPKPQSNGLNTQSRIGRGIKHITTAKRKLSTKKKRATSKATKMTHVRPSASPSLLNRTITRISPSNDAQFQFLSSKRTFLGGILNALKPAPKSAFDSSTAPFNPRATLDLPPINHAATARPLHPLLNHSQPHQDPHPHDQHSLPHAHQHGEACKYPPHTHSTKTEKSAPTQHSLPQQSQQQQQQQRYRKMTTAESDLAMMLCNIKHPETGMDIIQGEFVTQVKETSPGNILIKIKLDKNFRQIKTQIESLIASQYTIGDIDDTNSTASTTGPRVLKSVKISLADTQDDPKSLDPVKQPPQITTSINSDAPNPKLKTTSVGNSTTKQSRTQQPNALTTLNQTTGSGVRGLSQVKKVILVYSGKGGVGKSSVAVNLAAALSQLPAESTQTISSPATTPTGNNKLKIGIFDADIFGPSLPSLIDVTSLSQGIIGADGIDLDPLSTSQSIDLVEDYQDDTSALIRPIRANGIKLMSYGYVTRTKGGHGSGDAGPAPAIMRGGMVGPYLTELLTRTNWGELDALVIDMPPGTSDVHITITQQVKNASAVIVTTPSKLAFVDVVRGMQLLDQTNIPIVSLVQNMSYFVAPNDPTQTKHYIFGGGPLGSQSSPETRSPAHYTPPTYQSKLLTLGSIPTYTEIPIIPSIANDAEEGLPLTMKYTTTVQQLIKAIPNNAPQITKSIAHLVAQQGQEQLQHSQNLSTNPINTSISDPGISSTLFNYVLMAKQVHYWSQPNNRAKISRPDMHLDFDKSTHMLRIRSGSIVQAQSEGVFDPDAPEPIDFQLDPRTVRQNCVCAACIHEFTGTPLSDPNKVSLDVQPTVIQARGAYAVAVQWSDGHSGSIYTWDMLIGLHNKSKAGASGSKM